MSSLTIQCDDKIWINALTLWFESEDAIKAFRKSRQYVTLEEIREDQPVGEIDYISVGFDPKETAYDSNHIITLELE